MRTWTRIAAAAGLTLSLSGAALSEDGGLTVTDGKLTVTLTKADLDALERQVIETSTAWTEGTHAFSGPVMREILEQAGFAGETVLAEARDGYSVEIPRARLTGDGAILADSMDDAPLPEDKAPYWIVFPYDQSPEMNDEDHQSWSVWAVTKLTVR